jgi:hypothetical protein
MPSVQCRGFAPTLRRPEDAVLITLIEQVLITIYLCVLLIKSCNLNSEVCTKFGFGETADGLYVFFIFFALAMLLLHLAIGLLNLWFAGQVPQLVLVARSHSVSLSSILKTLARRRSEYLMRRVAKVLRLRAVYLRLCTIAATLRFRTIHSRRTPPKSVPPTVLPLVAGDSVQLRIAHIFPRTYCHIQVELDSFVIRWSQSHFVSLHTVERIRHKKQGEQKESLRRRMSNALMGDAPKQENEQPRSSDRQWTLSRTFLSTMLLDTIQETVLWVVHISYNDAANIVQELELAMPLDKAIVWARGLQELLNVVPRVGAPAYWRWALTCMASTSRQGASGILHQSELRSLLVLANMGGSLSSKVLAEVLQSVEAEQLRLPEWLRTAQTDKRRNRRRLDGRQVMGLLLRLCTTSKTISALFARYTDGDRMGLDQWLTLVQTEQLLPLSDPENGQQQAAPSEPHDDDSSGVGSHEREAELARSQARFEQVDKGNREAASGESGLSLVQVALLLLDSQNGAVLPARKLGSTEEGAREPLSKYWTAASVRCRDSDSGCRIHIL